ncbi:hypothetical protein ElyMa_000234800, partial [Elysia marginata]
MVEIVAVEIMGSVLKFVKVVVADIALGAVNHRDDKKNAAMFYNVVNLKCNLKSTNMVVQTFDVPIGSGFLRFHCATTTLRMAVYHYFVSDQTSFQVPVAYSQDTINPMCQPTVGSPGDHVDNDCDGEIDEDPCGTLPYCYPCYSCCCTVDVVVGVAVVAVVIIAFVIVVDKDVEAAPVVARRDVKGDVDIFGRSFTFLIPEHCSVTESVVILVTSESSDEFEITVKSPLDTTFVHKQETKMAGTHGIQISLSATNLKAGASQIYNTTLIITADLEISATLEMACPSASDISAVSARLIPNEGLGLEYFAVTVCKAGNCHIQQGFCCLYDDKVIDAAYVIVTAVIVFIFDLQTKGDKVCGTHILADKPVSVMSGGQLTTFINAHFKDGLLEMLPPVSAWGVVHYLVQTPVLPEVFVKVESTGPVLIFQITQELLFGLEVSASLVIPPRQWHRGDFLHKTAQYNMGDPYLLLVSDGMGISESDVVVDNNTISMWDMANLNSSFFRGRLSAPNDVIEIVFGNNIRVGGQLLAIGGNMAAFVPLAFKLDTINE